MKKFGTPRGAGPGSANEKVGLAGVGTPGPVGPVVAGDFGVLPFLVLALPVRLCVVVVSVLPAPLWSLPVVLEELCFVGFLLPFPDDELGVVDVLVVEVDVVLDVVVVVVVVDVVGVVTGTVGVVLVLGWQEAVTFWTGPMPAGTSCEGGVPGGALTMKVSVCPLSRVTVTVHWSAEAVGNAATAIVTSANAKLVAPIFSLRLLDTVSYLLPPRPMRHLPRRNRGRHELEANGWHGALQRGTVRGNGHCVGRSKGFGGTAARRCRGCTAPSHRSLNRRTPARTVASGPWADAR